MAKKIVAEEQPTVQSIARYIKQNTAKPKMKMHHTGAGVSVREATYKGHQIIIRTSYEITVDGQPVTGHVNVSNEGDVQYHAIPNFSFGSAVDLVRKLIDVFPTSFKKKKRAAAPAVGTAKHAATKHAGGQH